MTKITKKYNINKKYTNEINTIKTELNSIPTKTSQLTNDSNYATDTYVEEKLTLKADKDFYEVVFKNITPLTIDTAKLQEAINVNNARYIKFPSNCKAIMEDTIYLLNHCKIYGENTTLYKEGDTPFFSNTIPSGATRLEGVEINKIEFKKKTGNEYHIHLLEPYKCKVNKCKFIGDPDENGDYIVTNKSGIKFEKQNSDTCFVNYIEKCYFSKASIYMSGTDSYIRNNVIWGYTQEEAIKLYSVSNVDISNNQIVGGKVNGAIYADETGSACSNSRIVNNFFDGSYEDIESGSGLKGYFTLCDISSNTFYNQSKNGIDLYNPNKNTFKGNIFTQCNKGLEENSDIKIRYEGSTSFMNTFESNIFDNTRSKDNYYCIKEEIISGSPNRYNNFVNNMVPVGSIYVDLFSGKTAGTIDNNQFKSKIITNKVKIDKTYGTIETTVPNTEIYYNISGGCCSIDVIITNANIEIPAAGEVVLCKVIPELIPRSERTGVCSEFGKVSTIRFTLTTDGDLKLKNWCPSSGEASVVENLKSTLTYASK